MLVADLSNLSSATVYGLDQYDYGQKLELHGLSLPEAVEVHFAIDKSTTEAERRVGITKDGVTTVAIPDKMLEQSRPIVAYVYVTDSVSGKTVRKVTMPINPRQKPQNFVSPDDPLKEDPFRDAVMAVTDATERAKASEKSAEAWAHGSVDYPERDTDNARYYAEQAGADAERAEQVYTRTEKELAVILANAANYAVESKSAKEAAGGFAKAAEGHKNDAAKILNDVENVGAAKLEAIEKKGNEALESIPEDYKQLSGDVTELKGDLSKYAKITDIPEKLPNPQKLTFSGAVTAEYDGSGAVTVTIPEGSGGSGGTVRIENGSTDTTVELEPNKLYVFPEMAELTITLSEPTDIGIANEYHFVFQSGTTATTLTIPDTVKLPSNFSVDANKIYEISILEGCLCAQNWEVSA